MKDVTILKKSEMSFLPGCPVKSLAGHDKGEYFIILSEEGDFVLLADGRLRTVEKPKKKNKKHIQAAKQPLVTEFPITNEIIRKELKNYMKNCCSN